MNDMTSVIVPKSDQINSDDLIPGPITITITDVKISGGQEQPVSIYFTGSNKAFRPCKSMSRVLVAAWGADANKYVGRSLTLYRDEKVKWAGMEVGGIRISHMSHIDAPMTLALTATKGSRKPHRIEPLKDAPKSAAPDAARKWADSFIARLPTMDDADEVRAFVEDKRAKLDEMKEKRPELRAEIDLAIDKALGVEGGPSDDQRGEKQSLADVTAAIEKAATRNDVDSLFLANKTAFEGADYDALMMACSDRIAELEG